MGPGMSGKRPLENVSYQAIAAARAGARSRDIPCPVCGPQHKGASARRKVLHTWPLDNDGISLHCARCGLKGWIAPEDDDSVKSSAPVIAIDQDDERRRKANAALAVMTWRETFPIAGTAGEAYLLKRGIPIASVPDYGGLRWHPRCPWEGDAIPCIIARFTDAVTGEPRGIWRRPIDGQTPRTLGAMKGCVIRLWPDDAVTTGLVIGEGVETVAAAALGVKHRGTLLQPVWACGNAGNLSDFPVLPGIEALTILVDNDASNTGQQAAAACACRWLDADREVIRLTPKTTGQDFNDIIRNGSAA
jgi:Toprim domain